MKLWPFGKKTSRPLIHRPRPIRERSFYAGMVDRLTAAFTGVTISINESLRRDLDKMRQRSRQLENDNDYGKKYINMVKTNVIGSKGIRLQARAKGSDGLPDKMDNDAIEKAWRDFGRRENCTVTGQMTMLNVQHVSVGTAAADGECFARFVYGNKYKYGVALQLIETERVDTQLNQEAKGGKNRITMGIEFDEFDVPINYYVITSLPGESVHKYGNKKYLKVPAKDIIHLFKREKIGQARGIPWMHASIRRLDMIGGYEEAELVAARVGASKMGFYTTDTGEGYTGDDVTDTGELITEAAPGTFEQLPKNVKFESYDPQHPTGAYNYFLKGVLKGAAAGLNVSYTGFTGDLEAVNYSSIRAGLIEERENWRTDQSWHIENFEERVYKVWLTAALTRGLIVNEAGVTLPLSKKEKFEDIKWQARGWQWVDPLKDQSANEMAVRQGHTTNSDIVAAQGKDLEEIYEQLSIEKAMAAKYGLDFTPPPVQDKKRELLRQNYAEENQND